MGLRVFRPPVFQGSLRKKRYFEGWYLKHVSADGKRVVSFIPGVSLAPGDRHAFVQYIEGGGGRSGYVRYPLDRFTWSRRRFEVAVGPNRFSERGCQVRIVDGSRELTGSLEYSAAAPFPSRFTAPGIMGWYSFVPFMECNHGVVSANHRVDGELRFDGAAIAYTGGKGYIEKDWGSSFPSAWLWLQCNSFTEPEASVMVSVAKIPWLGRSFLGFLAFFYLRGRFYLFTTYNGSRVSGFSAAADSAELTFSGPDGTFRLAAYRTASAELEAPSSGGMSRRIRESVDGEVEVELNDPDGRPLYRGSGYGAGLETEGAIGSEAEAAGYTSRTAAE